MTNSALLTTSRRAATAIASLAAIAALMAGVPILLWQLAGWPLPTELPNPGDIGRSLTRTSVSDEVLVKAVALVGWTGWALLCWSLVVEIRAVIRGIPASTLRLAGPLQDVARRLVASVSLLAATGMSSTSPLLVDAPPRSVVVELREPVLAAAVSSTPMPALTPSAPGTVVDPPPAGGSATDAVPESTYTVQRRDSLWRIAECQLGDPLRWRELWELNRGRDFGGVAFNDPNLILPGWVLDLPTPATAGPAPGPTPPAAESAPPAHSRSTTPVETPPSSVPDPAAETNDLATTTTAPFATPAPSSESTTTIRSHGAPEAAEQTNTADPASTPTRAPLFAGGILLASAAIALLTRLRRTQARRRPPGHAPHVPPANIAPTETSLRHTSDPSRIHRALTALRALAAGLGDSSLPRLAAVRVSDSDIEVLLASPATVVPPGFDSDPERRAFTTEPGITTTAIEGLAGDTAAPWPAVVAAGAIGEDLVLIDLEAAGLLTVDGPDAVDTIRRIAAELATSPASDLIEVLVLDGEFDLSGSERIRPVASVDEAIDSLRAAAASTRTALDRLGDPNTWVARRDHSAEQGWGITALISLNPLSESQRARLSQIAEPGCGAAAAIVGSPVADAWSLTTGPTTRLEPHGFDLSPATISLDDLATIDALFADAMTGDSDERLLTDHETAGSIHLPAHAEAPASGPPEVEVRVLGPVDVHGVEPINRRRTVELVTYLALHPGGVSAGRLKTAIWPEGEPTQDTFNVTVHRARSALGVDSDGNHHLPHAVTNGGSYTLGPHVSTDLTRFNELVRRSQAASDEEAEAELLREAVALLRGQAFEGVNGYEWAFTEAIVTEVEATIADAAHRLAQLELARREADAANWAAMQGLKAVPGSEPLFRDRMEAAHLNGDPSTVDRIVDELCRYIETLEPLDDLHPDTIELWRRLGHARGAVDAPNRYVE